MGQCEAVMPARPELSDAATGKGAMRLQEQPSDVAVPQFLQMLMVRAVRQKFLTAHFV